MTVKQLILPSPFFRLRFLLNDISFFFFYGLVAIFLLLAMLIFVVKEVLTRVSLPL